MILGAETDYGQMGALVATAASGFGAVVTVATMFFKYIRWSDREHERQMNVKEEQLKTERQEVRDLHMTIAKIHREGRKEAAHLAAHAAADAMARFKGAS